MTSDERRALTLLANDPNGATEATLVAQGFSVSMLASFVVDGLVIARHEIGGSTMDCAGEDYECGAGCAEVSER